MGRPFLGGSHNKTAVKRETRRKPEMVKKRDSNRERGNVDIRNISPNSQARKPHASWVEKKTRGLGRERKRRTHEDCPFCSRFRAIIRAS